jgi:hypothetical protein
MDKENKRIEILNFITGGVLVIIGLWQLENLDWWGVSALVIIFFFLYEPVNRQS